MPDENPIQTLYGHLKTLTKQWFYDKTEIDTKLDDKLDSTDVPTKTSDLTNDGDGSHDFITKSSTSGLIKNDGTIDTNNYLTQHQDLSDYVEKSSTAGLIKNDGSIDTNTYLTEHQNISGKLDIAQGAGSASKNVVTDSSGNITVEDKPTIPTATSDLTNDGDGTNVFVTTDDSRLSDARTPTAHNQASSTITNSTAFDNILAGESTTLTLDDQAKINSALNTKIGSMQSTIAALEGLEFIVITTNKGTASASTMGKLYIENANNKTDAYYTENNSGTYSWEKLEDDILEDVSIDWSDIQNKPSTFTPASHVHGNLSNTGAIGSTSGKVVVTGTEGVLTTSDWVTEVDNVIQQLTTYGVKHKV